MIRIFSGIQPSNNLQSQYECIFSVVDLHAITVPQDPQALRHNVRELVATYVAAGIDLDKSIIFAQSTIPAHVELAWILGCLTPLGWLNRMTQFKDKAGKDGDGAGWGLYSYPVLMAADVLLYHGQQVPVGDDQKQHVELMRDIAQAFNRRYEQEYFTAPEPLILGEATRVMSLRDGTKKMSKSAESDYSRINLTDDADAIAQKIRKAKTDTAPLPESLEELKDRPEANNLITLYGALARTSRAAALQEFAGKSFSEFKPRLAELVVETIAPISTRVKELMADEDGIDAILCKGTERARAIADVTMAEVKAMAGF
jgi:tryptophanyl-tRNA synthetase